VRRMFEAVGHAVSRLIRTRYGKTLLPRGLKRGECMELDGADTEQLVRSAGLGRMSGKTPGVRASAPSGNARPTRQSHPSATPAKPEYIGADSLTRQRRDQKTKTSRSKALPRRAKMG